MSYFRKSLNFGGFRVNLSKSGIGYSYGIKGFRISTGPRGTYATVGAGGFYYRERIDKPKTPHRDATPPKNSLPHQPPGVVETADVSELVDTSSETVLSEINDRKSKMRITAICVPVGILVTVILVANELAVAAVVSTACFLALAALSYRVDKQRRTTSLFYELEGEPFSRFTQLQQSCQALSRSQMAWRVETNQATWDWKRNAGASSLITRRPITVGNISPPCIETNVDIWGINAGNMKLYFFPDRLFVEQNGEYGAVSYDSLNIDCSPSRFIEDGWVPRDAQVVGHTWKYVRRDGGPDRRFSNNRQLPILSYAHLEIHSSSGLNLHLQVSSISYAQAFSAQFVRTSARDSEYQRARPSAPRSRPGSGRRNAPPPNPSPIGRNPYEVLGITSDATNDEINAAYKRMAQLYHPDKVATMAPEFRELAERKMKEINSAYDSLKKRNSLE